MAYKNEIENTKACLLKFVEFIMRQSSLGKLRHTWLIGGGKEESEKQHRTYLASLSKWIMWNEKYQNLLNDAKDRNLWTAIITNILKIRDTMKKMKKKFLYFHFPNAKLIPLNMKQFNFFILDSPGNFVSSK